MICWRRDGLNYCHSGHSEKPEVTWVPAGSSRLSFNLAAGPWSLFGFIMCLAFPGFPGRWRSELAIGASSFSLTCPKLTHTHAHLPYPCYFWKGNVNVNRMSGLDWLGPTSPGPTSRGKEGLASTATERKLKEAERKQHRNRKRNL